MALGDGGGWTPLLEQPFTKGHPEVSPDGRWLAYFSQPAGPNEIYIRPFPNVNDDNWLISTVPGLAPAWSLNGDELFYIGGNALISVRVETEPDGRAVTPEALFPFTYYFDPMGRHYDVASDGRFLVVKGGRSLGRPRQVSVVRNWIERLTARGR